MDTITTGLGTVDSLGRPLKPVAERDARIRARLREMDARWRRLMADPVALQAEVEAFRRERSAGGGR